MIHLFALCVPVVWAYMSLWFIAALVKKDNGIADVAWGLGFVLVAWIVFIYDTTITSRQLAMSVCITVWAVRLSGYIYQRNAVKKTEDFRYAAWRKDWGKNWVWRSYLQVFMLQGFFMLLIALPVVVAAADIVFTPWNTFNLIGLGVFTFGFLFEAVADYQLALFKSNPDNKGSIMTTGLWRYSRHPNYFGEAVLWWGIFMLALPLPYWYVALLSPLTLTWLLTRVSGVPMLEKKYAGNAQFEAYARQTSAFFPMPVKKN